MDATFPLSLTAISRASFSGKCCDVKIQLSFSDGFTCNTEKMQLRTHRLAYTGTSWEKTRSWCLHQDHWPPWSCYDINQTNLIKTSIWMGYATPDLVISTMPTGVEELYQEP